MGQNLLTNWIERMGLGLRDRWFADNDGVSTPPIQQAVQRAMASALDRLELTCFLEPDIAALPQSQQQAVHALFKALKEAAQQSDVAESIGVEEAQHYLHSEHENIQEQLWQRIESFLPEHGDIFAYMESFRNFMQPRLFMTVQQCFQEELQRNEAAREAFEFFLLQAMQQQMQTGFQATHDKLDDLPEQVVALLEQKFAELKQKAETPPPTARPFRQIPSPTPHFVDRKDLLKALGQFLTNETQRIFVVAGLGGIGKTSLFSKALWKFFKSPLEIRARAQSLAGLLS